ncbi:MAG: hypothetical protein ACR2IF_16740 [Terriglobales bacterium]
MKFKINLATQPYENATRFFLIWGAVLVLVAILTGGLVVAAAKGWRSNHALSQKVAEERASLAKLQQQEQQDLAILNKPENRDVRDRSRVLNSLIRQKEFSWTLIFADLEKMMPTRLHVLSIAPQLDQNNEIEVRMVVGGASRDKAIELVQKMETSREFRHAQILAETNTPERAASGGDSVQFDITAQYVPVAPASQQKGGE